ncbi:MAG: hypothetical protein EBU46_21285 [Nitrosomonadaceae bacterium]|nr:hypothetical protein [Nitrosomonadaceae bacterium]
MLPLAAAGRQFNSKNWENDIFNPILWIEDIVFAYRFVPISVAVNCKCSSPPPALLHSLESGGEPQIE